MGIFDWFRSKDLRCIKCGSLIVCGKNNICSSCVSNKQKKTKEVTSDSSNEVKKSKKKTTSNQKLRVHTDEIERIDGIGYYQGKPFTGIYYSLYPNGNVLYETEKLNGLDHGISTRYNNDSTIHSVVNFSDGKVHDEDEEKHNEFLKKYLYE